MGTNRARNRRHAHRNSYRHPAHGYRHAHEDSHTHAHQHAHADRHHMRRRPVYYYPGRRLHCARHRGLGALLRRLHHQRTPALSYRLYDRDFSAVNVSSNGNLQFNSNVVTGDNVCLPYSNFNYAILPHWDDLRTDDIGNYGVFTSVTGVAPNRIFNVEWRASLANRRGDVNFEVRLYEGQTSSTWCTALCRSSARAPPSACSTARASITRSLSATRGHR